MAAWLFSRDRPELVATAEAVLSKRQSRLMQDTLPMSRLSMFARGIKVLDLSQYYPGPLATLLLADMGAEVIKIEPPHGDQMQHLGPRDGAGRPVFYEAVNAGKSVLRMDLKLPEEREKFLLLVQTADVVVEGFRPGTMARLGLDYQTLRKLNLGIVYCSINGWGSFGRNSHAAAHDANYLSVAGVLHRNGDVAPAFFDPPLADASGALFAVISILGALNARRIDGHGCEVDLALADVVMPLQLFQIADLGANGTVPQRNESYLNGGAAYYHVYRTRDGRHVMLGAVEPKFWRAFCEAAGHPEWIERQDAPTPQAALITDVSDFLSRLSLNECLERFGDVDCCLTPVLDLDEALRSSYHLERQIVRRSADGRLQALFPAYVNGVAPPLRQRIEEEEAAAGEATAAPVGEAVQRTD